MQLVYNVLQKPHTERRCSRKSNKNTLTLTRRKRRKTGGGGGGGCACTGRHGGKWGAEGGGRNILYKLNEKRGGGGEGGESIHTYS